MRLDALLIILSCFLVTGCKTDPDAFYGTLNIKSDCEATYFFEKNPKTKEERKTNIADINEPLICARPDEYQKLRSFYINQCGGE